MLFFVKRFFLFHILLLIVFTGVTFSQDSSAVSLGIFEGQNDIGNTLIPGSVVFNADSGTYTIAGSGENMWFDKDAFHFVWKKVSGDVSLAADINWIGPGGNPHRKACLIIRQSLEPNSPYADVVIHGNGLTSLQYREVTGGPTREIQSDVTAPKRIRIEKEGDYVFMAVALEGENLHSAGGSFKIKFDEPFYIGLGVCSHDSSVIEKAVFSNVEINNNIKKKTRKFLIESTLETISVASMDRRVVYRSASYLESPNWSRDGKYLFFNQQGKIYMFPLVGGKPELLNTGTAKKSNYAHSISPDGKTLAFSNESFQGRSQIYTVPIDGGTPKLITLNAPSYLYSWSPDGKILVYTAERDSNIDIYSVPSEGGVETRLTTEPGLDDGPDYLPDGKYIYFNSDRSGTMQIWRMKTDGSDPEQITNDEFNNWYPHPSPDGKWIVFLSYEKDVKGNPVNKDVMLRLIPVGGGKIQVLTKLFGGQGTINTPSWSPDGNSLAFVSYRLVSPFR